MSLLDNASLLLTPNAYKEGKLYSVIPSNGNGDFTATRATTATRVNSAGLVDLVPYNLLQYSEQFENAYWTKLNVTISSNATTAPNGTLTADRVTEDAVNSNHFISTTFGSFNAGSLTYSFYIKPNGRNRVLVREGASSGAWISFDLSTQSVLTSSASGSCSFTGSVSAVDAYGFYRVTCFLTNNRTTASNLNISIFTLNSTGSTFADTTYTGDGTSGFFLWGAQVVEGTSARDYLRTETRLNIPRVDYSLGGCPNILLEPQRTNLALQSSSFDNASWIKVNLTASANTTTSPSGVTDADSLIENTASGLHITYQLLTTTATTYSFSCYIKPDTRTRAYLRTDTSAGTVRTLFDLTGSGSVVILAHTSANIQSVGNGWYRCSITFTEGVGSSGRLFAIEGAVVTNVNYTGNGLNAFFLWGAQLEAGAYATSYIPTTTASVTRNADSITRNNIFTNGLITAAGGTWFVELKNTIARTRDTFAQSLFIGNSSTGVGSDGFSFTQSGSLSRLIIRKYIAGIETILFTLTADNAKIAIKWNGSTMDIFQNGVKVISSSAFTATNMQWLVGNGTDVPKYINEMALFPTPLTDAQCLALTA